MTSKSTTPPDSPNCSFESTEHSRKNRGRYLYWLLGIAGLIFVFVRPSLTTSADKSVAESTARAIPVETVEVESTNFYQVSRTYTGEIAATRTSNLGFSRGGEIEQILVQEGDRVTKRQPLAKLDIRNLQSQRQQIVAQKARAQAQLSELKTGARIEDIEAAKASVQDLEQQLELQKNQRARREFLYTEGAIAKEELDEFSFGEGALQARLKQARSNLAELQNGTRQEQLAAQEASVQQLEANIADVDINLDKSILKAPFNGIVAQRDIDEGTVVNGGQSVIRLVENAAPEARIGMPTTTINQLPIGSTQTIEIGLQTYEAKLTSILPEINSNTRTQIAIFNLEPRAVSQINPGQTVRLKLTQDINTDGYWLPTEALTQGIRGLWTCYVLTESEDTKDTDSYIVKQHAVEILNQSGDRVFVRGTIQPGDRIVANGTHRIVPGQRVKVSNE